MSKKFIAGIFAVAILAFAGSAAAAYDFGTTTLKVGSRGEAVKAVQTVVGATPVDGIFGNVTKAKVMVWQAANGLTADGLFGNASKAKANGGAVVTTPSTPTTGSTTLKGGAGTLDLSSTSTGVKSDVKEDSTEKILAFKAEADGSDIAVTNVKLVFANNSTTGSEKFTDYADEVKVFMGSTEVGSADASDFSKKAASQDEYSKTIALSNAVVKDGDKNTFYVELTTGSIDSTDQAAHWVVNLETVRYTDGTGAIMSEDNLGGVFDTDTTDYDATFGFKDSSYDDKITLKTSSSNPEASTVEVKTDDNTDEVLIGAFKLDVDDDSSDIQINELPIVVTFAGSDSDANSPEDIIDTLTVKIDGEEYEADLDSETVSANDGDGNYMVSFDDGDLVIDSGDVVEVKIYATFNDQENNYSDGTTVVATVAKAGIDAEGNDDVTVSGSNFAGKIQTLRINAVNVALVSDPTLAVSTAGTDTKATVYKANFVFNVTAPEDKDIYLPLDTFGFSSVAGIPFTVTGDAYTIKSASLSSIADDEAYYLTNKGYLVAAGDTEKFTYSVFLTSTDGGSNKVTIDSIWYETEDATKVIDGTTKITSGLTDFKTPTEFLAK